MRSSDDESRKKYITWLCFLFALTLMQTVEFFLHYYQKPSTRGHQIASVMIPLTVIIQVILISLCFNFIHNIQGNVTNILIAIFMLISIMWICPFLYMNYGKYKSVPRCKNGCRLQWSPFDKLCKLNINIMRIYAILYILIVLSIIYEIFGFIGSLWTLLLLLASLYLYNNVWGTMWCFSIVMVSCIIIIMTDIVK